jgi:hypothetical protein
VSDYNLERAHLLSELRLYVTEDTIQILKKIDVTNYSIMTMIKTAQEVISAVTLEVEREINESFNPILRQLSTRSRKE